MEGPVFLTESTLPYAASPKNFSVCGKLPACLKACGEFFLLSVHVLRTRDLFKIDEIFHLFIYVYKFAEYCKSVHLVLFHSPRIENKIVASVNPVRDPNATINVKNCSVSYTVISIHYVPLYKR